MRFSALGITAAVFVAAVAATVIIDFYGSAATTLADPTSPVAPTTLPWLTAFGDAVADLAGALVDVASDARAAF